MNKKKLKNLALKGVCSGLLVSAPGLMASQGSDAMSNFTANSSGQMHSNYLAGSCGSGCGGSPNKGNNNSHLTAYEYQPQTQQHYNQSCGASSCGNKNSYQQGSNQGHYQSQPNEYNSGSCAAQNQYQKQNGYNSGSCSAVNPHQQQHGSNPGAWNGYNQHSNNSNNLRNAPNQGTYANEDGVQIEYDNGGIPSQRQQAQPNPNAKRNGQTALNDAAPRSADNLYNQQNNAGVQPGKNQQAWPQNQGQSNLPGQQGRVGQPANQKAPGQLADNAIPQNQKQNENDLKAKRNNAANPK